MALSNYKIAAALQRVYMLSTCFVLITILLILMILSWKNHRYNGEQKLLDLDQEEEAWEPEEVANVSAALDQWYFDRSLVASVMSTLKETGPGMKQTLDIGRSHVTKAATVWCGNTFEFKHALSILSVIHATKPDVFHIYYATFPQSDEYNQWLQYILVNYPFFKFSRCYQCCLNGTVEKRWVDENIPESDTLIFVSINTLISLYNSYFRANNLMPNQMAFGKHCRLIKSIHDEPQVIKDNCFNLEKIKPFIPSDTWQCKSYLCDSIRYYLYKNPEPVELTHNDSSVIPNIAHYVYYGKKSIDFSFFMSILSLLYVAKVRCVYVHSDRILTGRHLNNLMKLTKSTGKVRLINRQNAGMVFGQRLSKIEHCSDTGKVDVLYKYGGIIIDPDVIFVSQPHFDLFHYDAVMNYDTAKTRPFPDRLNLGFVMARPDSLFVKIWRDSMRNFFDNKWLWNSGEIPYKIAEYNPRLVKTCKHLQVIVSFNRFRASWLKSQGFQHNFTTLEEWQRVTLSFHYVHPSPFKDLTSVWAQEGITGEVGRFVLKRAGIRRIDSWFL